MKLKILRRLRGILGITVLVVLALILLGYHLIELATFNIILCMLGIIITCYIRWKEINNQYKENIKKIGEM